MGICIFGLYKNFKCLADKCKATCCSGWRIAVDKEAYARFQKIKDNRLREDILSNIVENNGLFAFKNRAGGKCAMLDEDGLCRIQRNTDEKTLCNTCRKYPRLSLKKGEDTLLSMAASCPVVIDYLCQDNVSLWYKISDDNILYPLKSSEKSVLDEELTGFKILSQKIKEKYFLKQESICGLFYDFADMAVDIILNCNDCVYLAGSFDIYEEQPDGQKFFHMYEEFCQKYEKPLLIFEKNYVKYRILTKIYQDADEKVDERLNQILGEIIMLRVIMFSLMNENDADFKTNIINAVHWIYKTAVHGNESGDKMHKNIMKILAD